MTDTCRYLQITTFGLANEMFNVSQPQKVGYGSDEKSLDLDPCHCHVNFKKRDLHQNATELGFPRFWSDTQLIRHYNQNYHNFRAEMCESF